jgi:hypothetical protein
MLVIVAILRIVVSKIKALTNIYIIKLLINSQWCTKGGNFNKKIAMDSYTITFYCKDCLAVTHKKEANEEKVCWEVLDKLVQHELEMVDFNLTKNYETYPDSHKKNTRLRTVVEIRLPLDMSDLQSRDAIYNRCMYAMQQNQLYLSEDIVQDIGGQERQLLVFDLKKHAA